MRNIITGVLLLAAVLFTGCTSNELAGSQFSNQAPTVWLSSAPPEGTVSDYTLHLFWGGWDPDGEIAYYEYIITNNETGVFDPADTVSTAGDYKWNPVSVNDSVFMFTADVPQDSAQFDNNLQEPEEFRRSHTFFIRSVDEQGTRSPRPAYRSFTSRTLSPTVRISVPTISGEGLNEAQVPPITTFRWRGVDFVATEGQTQDPDSVRWIYVSQARFNGDWFATEDYIRLNPDAPEWSAWHYYQAPGDTGQFFTTPPLDFGNYVFAVQVKDEAGAVNPVFDRTQNMARFLVSTRSTGPVLTVRNEFLGTIVTSSPNTTPTILDLPAGVGMQFEFEADASSYGGIVSGYRYGWDILDLNDDEQWEIDFTPFIGDIARAPLRTFFFGTHSFHIEVIDNSGFKSRVSVTVNVVQFRMTRPLRLIDDVVEAPTTNFAGTKGALPGDGERDAFWLDMLSDVQGFDATQDVFAVGLGNPTVPITEVADYQNLIWNATASHNFNSSSVVAEMVRFKDPRQRQVGGKSSPNIPALFMAAGGHLLLAGQEAMTMVINRTSFAAPSVLVYPIIFRYELMGDQDGRYTSDGNDIGVFGVGERSFAYTECCLNVLDIAYIQNANGVRNAPGDPAGTACPVNLIRQHVGRLDGLRSATPVDLAFPRLNLRREAAGDPTRFYHESRLGLDCDIYNPQYFADMTDCADVVEYVPPRSCFQPIYALQCLDQSSVIFGSTIAFWTSRFANRVPDVGGVAARSAVWGFQPVYMEPTEVKAALAVILHDEWKLPRK